MASTRDRAYSPRDSNDGRHYIRRKTNAHGCDEGYRFGATPVSRPGFFGGDNQYWRYRFGETRPDSSESESAMAFSRSPSRTDSLEATEDSGQNSEFGEYGSETDCQGSSDEEEENNSQDTYAFDIVEPMGSDSDPFEKTEGEEELSSEDEACAVY